MSLVSTYVKADNGKFYENPVLSGEGWFICFDDEDPAELVIQKSGSLGKKLLVKDVLSLIGMKTKGLRKYDSYAQRNFGKGTKLDFKPAIAYFFEPVNPINHKFITEHDGVVAENKIHQGVIYNFERKHK